MEKQFTRDLQQGASSTVNHGSDRTALVMQSEPAQWCHGLGEKNLIYNLLFFFKNLIDICFFFKIPEVFLKINLWKYKNTFI